VNRPARWHFVRHLQTNKAARRSRVPRVTPIDRGVAAALERHLESCQPPPPRVRPSKREAGKGTKGGIAPGEGRGVADAIRRECPHVDVTGS